MICRQLPTLPNVSYATAYPYILLLLWNDTIYLSIYFLWNDTIHISFYFYEMTLFIYPFIFMTRPYPYLSIFLCHGPNISFYFYATILSIYTFSMTRPYPFILLFLWHDTIHISFNFYATTLSIYPREQVNFRWNDDEVHFVLDQHAELDFFYGASSLKQQSTGRHVAPFGHIILIPNQLVFALSP